MDQSSGPRPVARTSDDTLHECEELVSVRSDGWRFLVPLRHVERVLSAAMPAARPDATRAPPVVAIGAALVPVVFASALVGAAEVALAAGQQMVLLGDRGRRAVLWVDAVEDVVPHAAAPPAADAAGGDLVLGWSGRDRPLAVLDVSRLLTLATRTAPEGEA